jgi:hypothetical protein
MMGTSPMSRPKIRSRAGTTSRSCVPIPTFRLRRLKEFIFPRSKVRMALKPPSQFNPATVWDVVVVPVVADVEIWDAPAKMIGLKEKLGRSIGSL